MPLILFLSLVPRHVCYVCLTNLTDVCGKKADAEALPFDDNSFHVYTIAFGLRNVTDVSGCASCRRWGHRTRNTQYTATLLHCLPELLLPCAAHFYHARRHLAWHNACPLEATLAVPYAFPSAVVDRSHRGFDSTEMTGRGTGWNLMSVEAKL